MSTDDRLWLVDGTVRGVIHGPLPSLKNRRKLVMVGKKGMPKRPLFIKNDEAREYEAQFEKAVAASLGTVEQLPPDWKLYFKATVHARDMRRDLDCEFIPDLLQRFKLIANDRAIWRKEYERRLDRDNPRVEFEVGRLEDLLPRDEPSTAIAGSDDAGRARSGRVLASRASPPSTSGTPGLATGPGGTLHLQNHDEGLRWSERFRGERGGA